MAEAINRQYIYDLIEKLYESEGLESIEYLNILKFFHEEVMERKWLIQELSEKARWRTQNIYGKDIYIRGLIECTNYCRNNCYYCGIRRANQDVTRYRLNMEQIEWCCQKGYENGFRTFVLQGGEDCNYSTAFVEELISKLKYNHPDCMITLSFGEQEQETYARWKNAGADRYLLRHETATIAHYQALHPEYMSLTNRKQCLFQLKKLGYQVGAGMMIGSPMQKLEHLVADIDYMRELKPDMIGMGPFIPHDKTPFGSYPAGDLDLSLVMISLIRLTFPRALIPATTAMATLHPQGRNKAILAGANVVMPNLTPLAVRKEYNLYNQKAILGAEGGEGLEQLQKELHSIGYRYVVDVGNPR